MSDSMRDIYSADSTFSDKAETYQDILDTIQQYFTQHHADLFNEGNLSDTESERLQRSFIVKYLTDSHIRLNGYTTDALTDKIYNDMAKFGVLNDLLYEPNSKTVHPGLEEINVNSWEDIEVIYNGGLPTKTHIKFNSADDVKNMFDRILSINGLKIDRMNPTLVTYLPGGIRVCVNQYPIVSKADGIAASIRIVRPNLLSVKTIVDNQVASASMMNLIYLLHSFGVSIAISGGTSTGKTTFLSAELLEINDGMRIVIIEENTREINIVKRDENGDVSNNTVSLMTRPHHDKKYNISSSKLIERALTMNPSYIIVAEMKGEESIIAAEAAITGQVCMTTIHANEAHLAYERMVDLALKKYQMSKEVLMHKMVQAFPIIIQLEHSVIDGTRRVSEIVEAIGSKEGQPIITPLYRYDYDLKKHIKLKDISLNLQNILLKKGVSRATLEQILKGA